jgi:hypothetical protein
MVAKHEEPVRAGAEYAALRHGGCSAARAKSELGLQAGKAIILEALFQTEKPARGPDRMRPRFARHEAHVAAVKAFGGFPALEVKR